MAQHNLTFVLTAPTADAQTKVQAAFDAFVLALKGTGSTIGMAQMTQSMTPDELK